MKVVTSLILLILTMVFLYFGGRRWWQIITGKVPWQQRTVRPASALTILGLLSLMVGQTIAN